MCVYLSKKIFLSRGGRGKYFYLETIGDGFSKEGLRGRRNLDFGEMDHFRGILGDDLGRY